MATETLCSDGKDNEGGKSTRKDEERKKKKKKKSGTNCLLARVHVSLRV